MEEIKYTREEVTQMLEIYRNLIANLSNLEWYSSEGSVAISAELRKTIEQKIIPKINKSH